MISKVEDCLTAKEAAKFLRVSIKTLERWRRESKSPPYIKTKRTILYKTEDLLAWLELHKRL
jgi:excisionase family DNA binding protein